jgi:rubrerythrin
MAHEASQNEPVSGGVADLDEEEAEERTYECDNCDYRMEASHQPGECPQCGGSMIDINVSRE